MFSQSYSESLPEAVLSPDEKLRRELKKSLEIASSNINKLPKVIPSVPKLLSFVPSNQAMTADSFVDTLSELFGMISSISREQFAIISITFPPQSVSKVTKTLVQRIFNDSAFGIMTRVDASLRPKPPIPQLGLSDYLDCLLTVREKLSALQIILQEYSSAEIYKTTLSARDTELLTEIKSAHIGSQNSEEPDAISQEIHEYIKDQVANLLEEYLKTYFEKEMNWTRLKLSDEIKKATKDEACVQKVPGLAALSRPPRIRQEKFKSIDQIVTTIGNERFVSLSLSVIRDSLNRMLVIGQGDSRLSQKVEAYFIVCCIIDYSLRFSSCFSFS